MEIHRAHGLRQAKRYYDRLCAAGESGPYNQVSGAVLFREALSRRTRMRTILEILAEVSAPVSSLDLITAMGHSAGGRSTVPTLLLSLSEDYGLVRRDWDSPKGYPGGRWLYELSPLGQLVMQRASDD
jgi:hypothetical protein